MHALAPLLSAVVYITCDACGCSHRPRPCHPDLTSLPLVHSKHSSIVMPIISSNVECRYSSVLIPMPHPVTDTYETILWLSRWLKNAQLLLQYHRWMEILLQDWFDICAFIAMQVTKNENCRVGTMQQLSESCPGNLCKATKLKRYIEAKCRRGTCMWCTVCPWGSNP